MIMLQIAFIIMVVVVYLDQSTTKPFLDPEEPEQLSDWLCTLLCEVSKDSIGKIFAFFSTRIVYNFYRQKLYRVKH